METLYRRTVLHPHFPWYVFIFLAGLLLRWVMLDARPVHHDESLHYMYGRYFFDFPEQNFHRYDPMLHGPILYNVLRLVYLTLGSSTWAGRAFIALLGSLLIFTPFLFRRFLHPRALLALCAVLALSPTLTFWTRFLREDMLQVWATFLVLYGVVLARPERKALCVLIGCALQWCIKANFFVHLAILLGYLVFEFLWDTLVARRNDGLLIRLWRYVRQYEVQTVFAFILSAGVFVYFYTSGYRYSEGILDGLYRKSFLYWINQHNIERIPGPFMFHFFQLSWYEFLFMCAFITHVVFMYWRGPKVVRVLGGASAVLMVAAALGASYHQQAAGKSFEQLVPWQYLNLKSYFDVFGLLPIDVLGCIFLIAHAVLVTVYHLLRGERGAAFFGYFFMASFFTYSYLGEKVPWLALYPFLWGAIYLVLFFQSYFKEHPVASYREFSVASLTQGAAYFFTILGTIFLIEDPESLTRNIPQGLNGSQQFVLGALKNAPVLTAGVLLFPLGVIAQRLRLFGTVHLGIAGMVLFLCINVRATWMVNQVNGGKASEFMSQVHTTKELHDFALDIRKQILTPTTGHKPTIYVTGESTWPLTWYFVDLPQYKFNATPEEMEKFDYRFIDYVTDTSKQFPGYRRVDLNLRGWWVPDYQKMTLANFLLYSLSQQPFSGVGYSYVTVLVKEAVLVKEREGAK